MGATAEATAEAKVKGTTQERGYESRWNKSRNFSHRNKPGEQFPGLNFELGLRAVPVP